MKSLVTNLSEAEPSFWNDVVKKSGSDLVDLTKKGFKQYYDTGKKAVDYVTPKEEPKIKQTPEEVDTKIQSGENVQSAQKSIVDRLADKAKATQAYKDMKLAREKNIANVANQKGLEDTSYKKTLGVVEKKYSPGPGANGGANEIQREKQRAAGTGTIKDDSSGLRDDGGTKLTPTQSNTDVKPKTYNKMSDERGSTPAPTKIGDALQTAKDTVMNAGRQAKDVVMANPGVALGGAGLAAGTALGYLAYKKMKQKQAEKKAALA